MSYYLTYAYLRTKAEALGTWERLLKNAQREEGQIEKFLAMGIIILIVIAIAVVLYQFRDAVIEVVNNAIDELKKSP